MISYGALRIWPLPEGRFTVGSDKRFVPHDEEEDLPAGTLFISVTPFLIEAHGQVLLLDAGLGEYATGRDVSFLIEGIRRAGFEREDVEMVLLSHLHFDHAGGCVASAGGMDQPTFPNATYFVQGRETDGPGYSGVSLEARERIVHALDAAGQLERVDGDVRINDLVELQHTGGHTPHHQIVRLHDAGRVAVFGGDVLSAPSQATRSFRAKYDYDAEHCQNERRDIVEEAAEHGHLLLFYHSTSRPAGHVVEHGTGLRVEPVGEPIMSGATPPPAREFL